MPRPSVEPLTQAPATLPKEVEPARRSELKAGLDASGNFLAEEVRQFCEVYFKAKARQSPADHKTLNAPLNPAVDRFKAWADKDEDEAELWRGKLQAFRNLNGFLSQIIRHQDSDLERLCTSLRYLSSKLLPRTLPQGLALGLGNTERKRLALPMKQARPDGRLGNTPPVPTAD